MNLRALLISLSSITMLSASVRAFTAMTAKRVATKTTASSSSSSSVTAAASRQFVFLANGNGITPTVANHDKSIGSFFLLRSSSTSSDGPDTSIVDVCSQKIKDALDTTDVKVTGAYDDPNGSHISIEVVSSKFEGKRAVQRQQLVYKAIWEELQGPVHAVDAMICKTPDEA